MKTLVKSIIYLAACTAIFLFIVNMREGSPASQTATAFEWEKTVSVFFVDSKKASTESCEAGVALSRRVPNAETLGPGALEALVKGLTEEEKETLTSSIRPDALVKKFEVQNGVAYVDFNSRLNEGISGSCNVIAIRSQIENTLKALPDIDAVVISVNGQTKGVLEP